MRSVSRVTTPGVSAVIESPPALSTACADEGVVAVAAPVTVVGATPGETASATGAPGGEQEGQPDGDAARSARS